MERPCPKCEGVCGAVWKRDLSMVSSRRLLLIGFFKLTMISFICSLMLARKLDGQANAPNPNKKNNRPVLQSPKN